MPQGMYGGTGEHHTCNKLEGLGDIAAKLFWVGNLDIRHSGIVEKREAEGLK